jgi:hypothetical protein
MIGKQIAAVWFSSLMLCSLIPQGFVGSAIGEQVTVMTFYYPWYYQVNGGWEDGITGEPALGYYNSLDMNTVNQHIDWMTQYGISGVFVEWTGLKGKSFDDALKIILSNPNSSKLQFSFTYAFPIALGTVWEQGAEGVPSNEVDWTVNCSLKSVWDNFDRDIDYASRNYFGLSNCLKVDGKPVFYLWALGGVYGDFVGMLENERSLIKDRYGFTPYFVGDAIFNTEIAKGLDAMMPYMIIDNRVQYNQSYALGEAVDNIISQYMGCRNLCYDLGISFIPDVFPGYDDKNRTAYYCLINGEYTTPAPVIRRSVSDFRAFCEKARPLIDPEVRIIALTSWNEWYEGSTVEPATGYRFDYLQIVKEYLANYTPSTFNMIDKIRFSFSKVAKPSVVEGSTDTRDLAVAFDYIGLLDQQGRIIKKIDIGNAEFRRYMGMGWSGDEIGYNSVEDFVWAGGNDKYSTIYMDIPANTTYLKLYILPYIRNNQVTIEVKNTTIGKITPAQGWKEYVIPFIENRISLNLSTRSASVYSEILLSGNVTPRAQMPVTIDYCIDNKTWVSLTETSSNPSGEYYYNFTPTTAEVYSLRAKYRNTVTGTNHTSTVSTLNIIKLSGNLNCTCAKSIIENETLTINCTLKPSNANETIKIKITDPDKIITEENIKTSSNGKATYLLKPRKIGVWNITAAWQGNTNYIGSESFSSFNVNKKTVEPSQGIPAYPQESIVGVIIILVLIAKNHSLRVRKNIAV